MVVFVNCFGEVVVEVFYGVILVFVCFKVFLDKGLQFFNLFQVLVFVEDFIYDSMDVVEVYFFVVFIFEQLINQWFICIIDVQQGVYFLQVFQFKVGVYICVFVVVEIEVKVKYYRIELFLIIVVEVIVFVVMAGVVVQVS